MTNKKRQQLQESQSSSVGEVLEGEPEENLADEEEEEDEEDVVEEDAAKDEL